MNGSNGALVTAVLALCLSLTACTGSLFQSKALPPTIYVLSPGATTAAVAAMPAATTAPAAPEPAAPVPATGATAQIPVDLAILKPRVRVGLDTDRIAVLYPDRRLDFFADARWSGALADVLQDLAVQEFFNRANLRNVSADTSVFSSAYWLEIEVPDFQAEYTSAGAAPTVQVRLMCHVGSSSERRILGRFQATARRTATDNHLTAIVDAYARAADAALAEIVAHSVDILRTASEAR